MNRLSHQGSSIPPIFQSVSWEEMMNCRCKVTPMSKNIDQRRCWVKSRSDTSFGRGSHQSAVVESAANKPSQHSIASHHRGSDVAEAKQAWDFVFGTSIYTPSTISFTDSNGDDSSDLSDVTLWSSDDDESTCSSY